MPLGVKNGEIFRFTATTKESTLLVLDGEWYFKENMSQTNMVMTKISTFCNNHLIGYVHPALDKNKHANCFQITNIIY